MENFITEWEVKHLMRELSEGREQARQLQIHLNAHSSSYETREFLLHRIISSYDHALSMLQHAPPDQPHHLPPPPPLPEDHSPGRSLAAAGSPRADDSDQDAKDQASRKRKAAPKWTRNVKVSPEKAIEGQLDDGYGWRKYGQKDILGAKHPRGYYRCTNRHGQGCLATKQVQRSDEDPTVFVITYKREHTCNPHAGANRPEDPNPLPDQTRQKQEHIFNVETSFKVLATNNENSPIDFPGAINNTNDNPVDNIFGDCFPPLTLDNDFGGLILNATHPTESELSPIVAPTTTTSGTNTPALGTSFSAGYSGLDLNFFNFGHQGHYP